MQIQTDKVVKIDFTVKDSEDSIIDTTEGHEPLEFIHGRGLMIEALETQMLGRGADDTFSLSVVAADAYGERHKELCQNVPISMFEGMEIEAGMQLRATSDEGDHSVIVIEVGEEIVVVDGNHPLAGIDLTFDVTILAVRDATEEELDHGHIHAHGESCGHEH